MNRKTAIDVLLNHPVVYGHLLGFDKLTEMHNDWMIHMVTKHCDETLQGHRGSYKTTCVSIALAEIMILYPQLRLAFVRKTDGDVKEVIKQTRNILLSGVTGMFVEAIYGDGVQIALTEDNAVALTTNLTDDIKGTSQLTGFGTKSSVTGKHYDIIFTDDIVNKEDRNSRAEREKTKLFYQELINLVNRGGWMKNSGTPWHKDDAFILMPPPRRYDCYQTGLMSDQEIADMKLRMERSLFAANYELKHIASEDVLFTEPVTHGDPAMVEQGICHIDAAYGGGDYTAFTICKKVFEKKERTVEGQEEPEVYYQPRYYVCGKCWQRHVDDVADECIALRKKFNAGKIHMELNADKGYLSRDLKRKGERVATYHEDMNKYVKISTYLKAIWPEVIFVEGTEEAYIDQICDYNENTEHDDAPDSLASLARLLWNKKMDTYRPTLL